MSILAPLRSCSSWMRAPPAPMMRPTAERLISMSSPSWPGSVILAMNSFAAETCSCVPTIRTRQPTGDLSTSTCAPLRWRTSAICWPLVPMILPVAWYGSSMCSCTRGPGFAADAPSVSVATVAPAASPPPPLAGSAAVVLPAGVATGVSLAGASVEAAAAGTAAAAAAGAAAAGGSVDHPDLDLAPVPGAPTLGAVTTATAAARPSAPAETAAPSATSRRRALAVSTAPLVPEMRTCTGSSDWSRASIRAPLRSRMSLIVAPPLPMMRPMRFRGSWRTSMRSGGWKPRARSPLIQSADSAFAVETDSVLPSLPGPASPRES
mmetsp:Transcript_37247/g.117358  ORF Transcript_37247/g.117358 Transcript_37247/m.117358 type:complete len:322 (-) Transcript_37247:601-1566(-)